jgi:ComF family protein
MMHRLKAGVSDLLHLFFPHTCAGCGSDLLRQGEEVCINCYAGLAETGFAALPGNPVEKIFYGRIALTAASSSYYFTKQSPLQHLVHALKYQDNQDVGLQLGTWMAQHLLASDRFTPMDLLLPMPLYPERLKKRGYNQAEVLCRGMAAVLKVPVRTDIVLRSRPTETQTRKGRTDRWTNVTGSFELCSPGALEGKHLLLVDDVVTTGATLEACAEVILQAQPASLRIATLAWASSD